MAVSLNHTDHSGWFPYPSIPDLSGQTLDQLYAASLFPCDLTSLSRLFWLSKAFDWAANISYVATQYYNFSGTVITQSVDTGTMAGSGTALDWDFNASDLIPGNRVNFGYDFRPSSSPLSMSCAGSVVPYGLALPPFNTPESAVPYSHPAGGSFYFNLLGQVGANGVPGVNKYNSTFCGNALLQLEGGDTAFPTLGGFGPANASSSNAVASALVFKITIAGVEFDLPVFVPDEPPPPLNNGTSRIVAMSGTLTLDINSFWT